MINIKPKILKISVVLIALIIGILILFWLPNIANYMEEMFPECSFMKKPLLIGISSTGIPFYIAVFYVFKLIKLIEKDEVFTLLARDFLKVISKCSLAEIVLYFGGIVYLYINNAAHPSIVILGLLIMFAAFIIYIFIEILSELLLKAVEIKTENELTI